MNAKDAIQFVVEGKAPTGWAVARGVYADLSKWPREVEYYLKCPKCGLVHGGFKSMRDAHAKRLCDVCNVKAINDIKDQIQDVIHDPSHKPKSMAKIVGNKVAEAIDTFDPFDEPPAEQAQGVPLPPEDEPEPSDTMGEIDRLLLGNWVDVALREFCNDQGSELSDIEIDDRWHEGNYDKDNPESTTKFKVDIGRNEEWLFFKDSDEAESYALGLVRNDLKNEPEIFAQDWLKRFVDEDKLKYAIGDLHEEWEDDVRTLDYEELLTKMVDENYVEFDDPVFFKKNGELRLQTQARADALNVYMEDYIEKEKPTFEPWEYMEDTYGKEEAGKEAIKMVGIDVDAAAKNAVNTDGWPHFVARYDNESHDLENGGVYCRIN